MKIRDGVIIVIALLMSELVLAGMIDTKPYALVASAQAHGFDALANQILPWGTR